MLIQGFMKLLKCMPSQRSIRNKENILFHGLPVKLQFLVVCPSYKSLLFYRCRLIGSQNRLSGVDSGWKCEALCSNRETLLKLNELAELNDELHFNRFSVDISFQNTQVINK